MNLNLQKYKWRHLEMERSYWGKQSVPKLLSLTALALIIILSFCSCKTSMKKTKGPDLVAIAEKTKPERAVSETENANSGENGEGTTNDNMDLGKMDDYVLARIDGEPVTNGEVLKATIGKIGPQRWKELASVDQQKAFAAAFQGIVARKLILSEAKDQGYAISDDRILSYIKSQIPEINQKFGGDVAKYADSKKLDYDEFVKTVKDDMIYDVYLRNYVFPKESVSPQEIRDYYEKHQSEFFQESSAHIYAITFYRKGDPVKDALEMEKAKEVLEKIDKGEDFEKLAKEYTEDNEKKDKSGDWGWVSEDYFAAKEINEELSKLKPGEHSGIIETDVAYWIIKVVGKKAESTKPISEAWKDIELAIRKARINEAMAAVIEKLQKKHNIIIHNLSNPGR